MNQTPVTLYVVTLLGQHGATGVQSHFNAITEQARKLGHEAHLITPHNSNVKWLRRAMVLLGAPIKIINHEWSAVWSRWSHYWLIRYQLFRMLKPGYDTIIYAQCPLSANAALSQRKQEKVILVVHFNVSEADEMQKKGLGRNNGPLCRFLEKNERKAFLRVDKILFVSRFMQKEVHARIPEIINIEQRVLPNFITDPSDKHASVEKRGDLISIGTLETRKNQEFLLRILAAAHAKGYAYRLVIVGEGPDRAHLEALTAQLRLTDYVEFLGFIADAANLLPAYRVYTHAAFIENLPISLLEALAYGLPILAPEVGGIPEIYGDGEAGFYWQLDDANQAAEKLIALLEDNARYQQFSDRARSRFLNRFSQDQLAGEWMRELMSDQIPTNQ